MKMITLREGKTHPHRKLLDDVLGNSPMQPMTVKDVLRRGIMLAALEKAQFNSLVVEDEDYEILKKAVNDWPWQKVSVDICTFIEDVLNAKEPPDGQGVEPNSKAA